MPERKGMVKKTYLRPRIHRSPVLCSARNGLFRRDQTTPMAATTNPAATSTPGSAQTKRARRAGLCGPGGWQNLGSIAGVSQHGAGTTLAALSGVLSSHLHRGAVATGCGTVKSALEGLAGQQPTKQQSTKQQPCCIQCRWSADYVSSSAETPRSTAG